MTYKSSQVDMIARPIHIPSLKSIQKSSSRPQNPPKTFKTRPQSSKQAKLKIQKSFKPCLRYDPPKQHNQHRRLLPAASDLQTEGDMLIHLIDSAYDQLEDRPPPPRVDWSVEMLYGQEMMKQAEVRSTNTQLDQDIKVFRSRQRRILEEIKEVGKRKRSRPGTAKVMD